MYKKMLIKKIELFYLRKDDLLKQKQLYDEKLLAEVILIKKKKEEEKLQAKLHSIEEFKMNFLKAEDPLDMFDYFCNLLHKLTSKIN